MIKAVLLLSLSMFFGRTTASKKKNVILFVIDDLGWGDLHFSGLNEDRTAGGHAEMTTPHLDTLAREGVVLDQYYVNELCSPTRTSLLSSRYAYNIGLGHGVITNGHAVALRLNESTMANHFKEAGYSTHAFGKWDIGYHTWAHTPTERGFDHYLGYYNADEDYITHKCGGCGCKAGVDLHDDLTPKNDTTTYSTIIYTDGIVSAIKNASVSADQPFFIYAAYQAVHGPLEAPQRFIDACAAEDVQEKDRLIFCGMIKALDEGIGNVTAALYEAGLENDTIIALSADNGGQNGVGGNNWPLRGNKATLFEGGVRATAFFWGQGLQHPGRLYKGLMHGVDIGPTLFSAATGGKPFANESQKKDGIDHWGAISLGEDLNHTEPRTEVLLGLFGPDNGDPSTYSNYSAIRIGDWKLVVNVPEAPCIDGNVSGNNCLKRATGWVRISGTARIYNKPAVDQICTPGACLFNLAEDPKEEVNLIHSTDPHAVQMRQMLVGRLNDFNSTAIPNQRFPCDLKSCPENFDGFWMPWLNSTPPTPQPGPPATASSVSTLQVSKSYVRANGWVCDNSDPEKLTEPCTIFVSVDDGNFTDTIMNATIVRPKLVINHDCADTHHGFEWQLNQSYVPKVLNGKHKISFSINERATGKQIVLDHAPQCICDGMTCPCKKNEHGFDESSSFAVWSTSVASWASEYFSWNSNYAWEGM